MTGREGDVPTGRPRVSISVDGIQTQAFLDPHYETLNVPEALVDTGSTHTLISRALNDRLPPVAPLFSAPTMFGMGAQKHKTHGVTCVSIHTNPVRQSL